MTGLMPPEQARMFRISVDPTEVVLISCTAKDCHWYAYPHEYDPVEVTLETLNAVCQAHLKEKGL